MTTSSRPAWALEGDRISKVKMKQKKESWQVICAPTYIKKFEHFTEYQGKVFFFFNFLFKAVTCVAQADLKLSARWLSLSVG